MNAGDFFEGLADLYGSDNGSLMHNYIRKFIWLIASLLGNTPSVFGVLEEEFSCYEGVLQMKKSRFTDSHLVGALT